MNIPYQTFENGQGGSYLTFEVGTSCVALPYFSLGQVTLKGSDRISLEYSPARVDIVGSHLAELFVSITRSKVERVRPGSHAELRITAITYTPL